MADITYASDPDETTFSASTKKGEDWMGAPKTTMPTSQAKDYREAAVAAGLIIKPFP